MQKQRFTFPSLLLIGFTLLSILLALAWATILAAHASFFDGFFANGAFQLFNPLRRVMAGQHPGIDFPVFHGIGTVYLHLPLFVAFGQTLQASEISRYAVSPLLHIGVSIAVWRMLRPVIDERLARIAGLALFVTGPLFTHFAFLPENSLLGARSFFPMLIPAVLLLSRSVWLLAIVVALALFCSVEHGLAVLCAMACLSALTLLPRAWIPMENPRRIWQGTLGGIVLFMALLTLSTHGNPWEVLQFTLKDIPTDQFWYFGSIPNSFLPADAHHFWHNPLFRNYLLVWAVGWGITGWQIKHRDHLALISLYLMVYASFGMISQLGYISAVNLHPSLRAILIVLLIRLVSIKALRTRTLWLGLFGILVLAITLSDGLKLYKSNAHFAPADEEHFLSRYWRDESQLTDRLLSNGTIWSIYSGLPEARHQQFAFSTDYIIHSLGPKNRAEYVTTFLEQRPDLVRLDNLWAWTYGNWLIDTRWDFFQAVFSRYELVGFTKWATFWKRPAGSHALSRDSARLLPIRQAGNCFEYTPATERKEVYTVEIDYTSQTRWSNLPILGKTTRLIIDIKQAGNIHSLSIPPVEAYGGKHSFPLVSQGGEPALICPRVISFFPDAKMNIDRIKIVNAGLTESARMYLTGDVVKNDTKVLMKTYPSPYN